MPVRRRPALFAVVVALVLAVPLAARLPVVNAEPVSMAAERFVELAGEVREADGFVYDVRDDGGRTMDTAEILQAPSGGTYLAVYHSTLADGRFHAAVATSTDLRTWTRRHDFGAGTSQPSLAPNGRGGYVLAYEKDPDNHIAVRGYPGLNALLAGEADHAYDAFRTLSRCAEGTPDVTAVHGGTVELTGHYQESCGIDRQLRATLRDFMTWHVEADGRLDRAVAAWGTAGNIGDRTRIELGGEPLVLIEGQRLRDDFGSWRTYAYDPVTGRADRVTPRTHGGSTSLANPSAALVNAPDGRPALVVSLFVPREGAAKGEAGQLLYWREL